MEQGRIEIYIYYIWLPKKLYIMFLECCAFHPCLDGQLCLQPYTPASDSITPTVKMAKSIGSGIGLYPQEPYQLNSTGRERMATIWQMIFFKSIFFTVTFCFQFNFIKNIPGGFNWQWGNTGSGNGLVPNCQSTITLTLTVRGTS